MLSSHQDLLNASQRILLRTTAGNVDSVLADLKTLCPINLSDSEKMLSECDHESGRVVLTPSPEQENVSGLINHVEYRLNDYLKKNYTEQAAARVVIKNKNVPVSKTDSFDIVVYAEKVDVKNCYSGSWCGRFHIECAKDITVSGTVKVSAHVFENDNVQMTCTLHFSPQREDLSPTHEDISKSIVSQIQRLDSQILLSMESLYDNVSGSLKVLRKAIPVTRTKFDWNLNSQRFRKTLSNGLPIK
jgi:capping protein alpha